VRRRPDGTLLEVRTDPTPEGGFIRTYRDVTEEHAARAELERARDAALAAARARSGFLAAVTHELRTPLNAVIGFSEAIVEETRAERMRGHAAEVLTAGRQLLALVDGILAATRMESGEEVADGPAFDPAPVLRAAAADAAAAAEVAGLELGLDVPRRLPAVRGDQRRLRQALDAILSNAVKFTPPGGTVRVSAAAEGGLVTARVSDSGIGMDPADIPRAFEAFTQLESGLDRRYAGAGLGLYLARALTAAMGMDLALESAPGIGTTATVTMRGDADVAVAATNGESA
jgi:signal transduction histidine kinase